MPDDHAIERRLAAVERALTDGHDDLADLREGADLAARVDDLETTAERLERRVADLDAAVQALRGYVGNARSVNRAVERRADAALATAERAAGGTGTDRCSTDADGGRTGRPLSDEPSADGSSTGRPAADEPPGDDAPSTRPVPAGDDPATGHGSPE